MVRIDSKTKRKIFVCFLPLIVHIVLVILAIIFSCVVLPYSDDLMTWKRQAFFIVMCRIYYASTILLLPIIGMVRYYVIWGDLDKVSSYKQGIKSCMFLSTICMVAFFGIAIAGIVFSVSGIRDMPYFGLFFVVIVAAILYLCVVVMFAGDFLEVFHQIRVYMKNKQRWRM